MSQRATRRSGFAHATEDILARLPVLLDGPALVMHNAVCTTWFRTC